MSTQAQKSFWTRWRRGFNALWRAYALLLVAYLLFSLPSFLGGAVLEALSEPWRMIFGITFFLGIGAVLVVFVPVMISKLEMDPASIREDLVSEIEPSVDVLAERFGVNWEEKVVSEINALLEEGNKVEARRRYRDHAGVTWDEVDKALENWSTTRLKEKLAILEKADEKANEESPTKLV